jgi:soluble lytic murein transglycosylase-like protein
MWWSNCRREHGQDRHIMAAAQKRVETEKAYPAPEEHLFHPGTNVLAGTWYLRKLLRCYQGLGDLLPYALAECNASRANVLKRAQGPAATNSSALVKNVGYPGAKDYLLSIHVGQA